MAIFDKKEQPGDYYPEPAVVQKPKRSLFKWLALGVGTFFGVAHIGVVGHLMNRTQVPIINLPVGDYTAYTVDAYEGGYRIQYRSNAPQVMGKDKVVVFRTHPCKAGNLNFFSDFFFFGFLGPHLWYMEVPRLWVKLELQLPA